MNGQQQTHDSERMAVLGRALALGAAPNFGAKPEQLGRQSKKIQVFEGVCIFFEARRRRRQSTFQ